MAYHERYCVASEEGAVTSSGSATPHSMTVAKIRPERILRGRKTANASATTGKSLTNVAAAIAMAGRHAPPRSYQAHARIMSPAHSTLLCDRCMSPTVASHASASAPTAWLGDGALETAAEIAEAHTTAQRT